MDKRIQRVTDPNDPRRCQHVIPTQGQCMLISVEGSQNCIAHGGNVAAQAKEKQDLRNYRLARFRQRAAELGNSDAILSLKDEIGILRLLVEERLNRCKDVNELMLMSGPLSDLMMKIEKVVVSCNRLEGRLGNLLDRTKVMEFGQMIVQIISNYIHDEKTLDQVSEDIAKALGEI